MSVIYLEAGAPSPALARLRAEWGFDPRLVTVAFSGYVFTLLVTLVIAGSLSDYLGEGQWTSGGASEGSSAVRWIGPDSSDS